MLQWLPDNRNKATLASHLINQQRLRIKRTVDPRDDETFSQGENHERKCRTIPVHDLEEVDTTLKEAKHTTELITSKPERTE